MSNRVAILGLAILLRMLCWPGAAPGQEQTFQEFCEENKSFMVFAPTAPYQWLMAEEVNSAEENDSTESTDFAEQPVISTDSLCCYEEHHSREWWSEWKLHLFTGACQARDNIWSDFRHNYSLENLGYMALGVALAAPLANTDLDNNFSGWYQRQARSNTTDEFARVAKVFGNHEVMVPIYLGVAAAGWALRDWETGCWAEEWSKRTLRAMMVGAPAVGVLQYGLGGHRPSEGSSHWQPLDDTNAVAGHGFIGAAPFLTVASMTKNRLAKTALFAGSFLTSWSRLHDDSHSLSQIMLGWWLAYLAVESVNRTEEERRFFLAPRIGPDEIGVTIFIPF